MDPVEAGKKESLATQRTDLAEDRTLLANERTFAGWVRTGLTSVGVAIGLHALFRTLEPIWVAKAIATMFVALGIFIFLAAERRACSVEQRLEAHEVSPFRRRGLRIIACGLILASAALIAALWLLV
jgi:putative membrane protein